jgi:hypothetical protein
MLKNKCKQAVMPKLSDKEQKPEIQILESAILEEC